MAGDSKFYEHGFEAKAPVKGMDEDGPLGSKECGYLEGHNSSPSKKEWPYEAEGAGSKGPAAR